MAEKSVAGAVGGLALIGVMCVKLLHTCEEAHPQRLIEAVDHIKPAEVDKAVEDATHSGKTLDHDDNAARSELKKQKAPDDNHINPEDDRINGNPGEVQQSTSFSIAPLVHKSPSEVEDDQFADSLANDAIFLSLRGTGFYRVAGSNGQTYQSLKEVPIHGKTTLIVDNVLTVDDIDFLRQKGITFLYDKSVYIQQRNTDKYQVIVVYSDNEAKLKDLYEIDDNQARSLIRHFGSLSQNRAIATVDDGFGLAVLTMDLQRKGITPVVIFHNNNGLLFGSPLSNFDISNAITCNSFQFQDETFLKTTNFIDIASTIKSIPQKKPPTLFEFYHQFTTAYNQNLSRQQGYKIAMIATLGASTLGGSGIIIYYTRNKT